MGTVVGIQNAAAAAGADDRGGLLGAGVQNLHGGCRRTAVPQVELFKNHKKYGDTVDVRMLLVDKLRRKGLLLERGKKIHGQFPEILARGTVHFNYGAAHGKLLSKISGT